MSTLKMRAPLPVQVACDKIALNATLHATLASPASKSGEYTGGRLNLGSLSGKHSLTGTFMGDSFMSKMSSHEAVREACVALCRGHALACKMGTGRSSKHLHH
jgi:hypothetical protein